MPKSWTQNLKGKIVIVGIGNPLRGDDGLGPALIESLKNKIPAVCIDAGSAPESYAGKIIKEKPDTVLLVDAVHLGLSPGEFSLLKKDEILKSGFSTHDMSPHLLIEYLEKETPGEIFLLGVQPQDISFGAEMSEPVKKTIAQLNQDLKEYLHA